MDILAHAMFGGMSTYLTKHKISKKFWWKGFFWGAFPDLFAFTVPFCIIIGQKIFDPTIPYSAVGIAQYLYQYSHSLIIAIAVLIAYYLIYKKIPVLMIGWPLHILCDIPTHTLNFFPTPFLFPLSNYKFPYAIPWSTPLFWIGTWLVIIFLLWQIVHKEHIRFQPFKSKKEPKGVEDIY